MRPAPIYTIGSPAAADDRGIPVHSWSFRVDKKNTTDKRKATFVIFNNSFVVPLVEEDERALLSSLKKDYSTQVSFHPLKRAFFGLVALGPDRSNHAAIGNVAFPGQPSAHYFWETYLAFVEKEETDFPA